MTDCQAARHQGQTEPTPTEVSAFLCKACRLSLARDLARLPGLYADLACLLPARQPGTRGNGQGLPYHVQAAELTSQIAHDLAWWTTTCAAYRRAAEPYPPTRPEVPALAHWLHQLASPPRPWIPFQDFAPLLAGAIADDRHQAVAILDPWIRKRFPIRTADGICPDCGTGRLWITIYDATDRSFAACDSCGQRWESMQWLRLGQRIIARRQLPHWPPWKPGQPPQTSPASTTPPVPPSTGGPAKTTGSAPGPAVHAAT